MNTDRVQSFADHFTSHHLSRRWTLTAAAVAALPAVAAGYESRGKSVAALRVAQNTESATPITGIDVPELAELDRTMSELMGRWELPGGQLSVAKDGRLVHNRGYGLADKDRGEPVQPDALFRIASVSKTITAVAILALVDDGVLALDDKAFPLIDLEPPANAPVDPRLAEVTVEHLLVHSGGWDSGATYDPQYMPWSGLAAHVIGAPQPSSGETIVRFMLGQPLDFDPGTRSVYSNFGFNVLARVIERASGQSYEAFTRTRVLTPAGIDTMSLARTRREDRAKGEVSYYGPSGQAPRWSVFPGEGFVAVGEGSYYLEALDGHGGWVGSAADLARFATAVDGQRGEAILAPATVETMLRTARPASGEAGAGNEATSFGLGWVAMPTQQGIEWSHAGALEGSNAAWLIRADDGLTIAFTVNSLPEDFGSFFGEAIPGLRAAVDAVTVWPEHDLF